MNEQVFPVPPIAGNSQLLSELRQMKQNNRLPHALLLHGMQGCGKKEIAEWFAMLVLCEQKENAPCGKCRNCKLVRSHAHPDVTAAEHSGKRGGFSVDTVREIRAEAAVLPNNGEMRIFMFTDADGMSIQAQNALLKSVEEPPAHACFVFTAQTPGVLLPTLLSRMTAKAVFPVSRGECIEALTLRGFSGDDAINAASRFGGNLGKCIAYLTDPAVRETTDRTAELTAALAAQDEYRLLRLLTAAAADKDQLRKTLELLDIQIRDAALMTLNSEAVCMGCDRQSARQLSEKLTPRRTARMHGAVAETFADLDGNVGAVLAVTALCAALANA
ncbi:MAG: hypothetical protein IKI58_11645 [Oscillospiraceae bacterium]|nr:hypothetical protein [Oscillospiraceae bacterium]